MTAVDVASPPPAARATIDCCTTWRVRTATFTATPQNSFQRAPGVTLRAAIAMIGSSDLPALAQAAAPAHSPSPR